MYDAPPMVTPSKFGNVAMLRCAWRFERIDREAAAAAQSTEIAEVQRSARSRSGRVAPRRIADRS